MKSLIYTKKDICDKAEKTQSEVRVGKIQEIIYYLNPKKRFYD
jgi:hypothetical protein